MEPIKVTFDTNVWQKVILPENYADDLTVESYYKIHIAIKRKIIVPYISSTIFTIEAIPKKNRLDFLRVDVPNIEIIELENEDGSIGLQFTINPNSHIHPGNNEYIKLYLEKALALGFHIIPVPRIGGITNPDTKGIAYNLDEIEYKRVAEVCQLIESKEAGVFDAMQIGFKYNPNAWYIGLGNAPDSERNKIAKALAEWSDGDSIAAHIGIKGDFFCTNDKAKGAGNRSILSQGNLLWLKEKYSLKVISPTELADALSI